jgi:hypothetical protein
MKIFFFFEKTKPHSLSRKVTKGYIFLDDIQDTIRSVVGPGLLGSDPAQFAKVCAAWLPVRLIQLMFSLRLLLMREPQYA